MSEALSLTVVGCPPVCSEAHDVGSFKKVTLMNIRGSLHDCVSCLSLSTLGSEVAVLLRLRYKHRNQLRQWKGLARLKQMDRCVRRINAVDVPKQLTQLLDMIPGRISQTMEKIYLPTSQLVEFVYLRMCAVAAVLQKIIGYCLSAYELISQQLNRCLFVKVMTVMAASVSRVWVISRSLVEQLESCCENMRTLLQMLNPSAMPPTLASLLDDTSEEQIDAAVSCSRDSTTDRLTTFTDSSEVPRNPVDGSSVGDHLELKPGTSSPHKRFDSLMNGSEVVDRNWFNSLPGNSNMKHFDKNSKDSSSPLPLPCKSPLVRRVAKFLAVGNNSTLESSPPKSRPPSQPLTSDETRTVIDSIAACSNIAQLYVALSKISRSRQGTSLRGMKKCLAQLRKLKSMRGMCAERSERLKYNRKLLKQGRAIVENFVELNQSQLIAASQSKKITDGKLQEVDNNATTTTKLECINHSQSVDQIRSNRKNAEKMSDITFGSELQNDSCKTTTSKDQQEKCRKKERTASNNTDTGVCRKLPFVPETGIHDFLAGKLADDGDAYMTKLKRRLLKSNGALRFGSKEVRIAKQKLHKIIDCMDEVTNDARLQKHRIAALRSASKLLQKALVKSKPLEQG